MFVSRFSKYSSFYQIWEFLWQKVEKSFETFLLFAKILKLVVIIFLIINNFLKFFYIWLQDGLLLEVFIN